MANNDIDQLISIKDENSQAFNKLFDRLGTLDLTPILIYLIDNVKTDVLPHLAEQFHILGNEGWLFTKTEDEKRQLIKSAVQIHKYKGTKFALEKVLEILNLNGKITEWFAYGGNPYHFMVILNLFTRGFDQNSEKQLLDLIDETKNVRSVMEKLEVNFSSKAENKIITAFITSEEITL